jgi:hypothetical protein
MKQEILLLVFRHMTLKKALIFYRECFKLEGVVIEEDSPITIELGNLSLYLWITKKSFVRCDSSTESWP